MGIEGDGWCIIGYGGEEGLASIASVAGVAQKNVKGQSFTYLLTSQAPRA